MEPARLSALQEADGERALSVSEVSARIGLPAHTLRYYESTGLLPPVARSSGGRRQYQRADLNRPSFLIDLRATGMSIAMMQRFAAMRREGEASRPARLALILEHRAVVAKRLSTLRRHLCGIDAKVAKHRQILRARGALPMASLDVHVPAFCFGPVHHVQLAIPPGTEATCRRFWEGVLGMEELPKPVVLAGAGSAAAP